MAKHEFGKDNQPKNRKPRGRDKRTLILEALERQGVTEDGFYDRLVIEALGLCGEDADDSEARKVNQVAFTELWKRFHPVPKPVAPTVEFDYPKDGTLLEKAQSIELGIAEGIIPPDIGMGLIQTLSNVAKVEEVTEIKDRLERLEELLEKGE